MSIKKAAYNVCLLLCLSSSSNLFLQLFNVNQAVNAPLFQRHLGLVGLCLCCRHEIPNAVIWEEAFISKQLLPDDLQTFKPRARL